MSGAHIAFRDALVTTPSAPLPEFDDEKARKTLRSEPKLRKELAAVKQQIDAAEVEFERHVARERLRINQLVEQRHKMEWSLDAVGRARQWVLRTYGTPLAEASEITERCKKIYLEKVKIAITNQQYGVSSMPVERVKDLSEYQEFKDLQEIEAEIKECEPHLKRNYGDGWRSRWGRACHRRELLLPTIERIKKRHAAQLQIKALDSEARALQARRTQLLEQQENDVLKNFLDGRK